MRRQTFIFDHEKRVVAATEDDDMMEKVPSHFVKEQKTLQVPKICVPLGEEQGVGRVEKDGPSEGQTRGKRRSFSYRNRSKSLLVVSERKLSISDTALNVQQDLIDAEGEPQSNSTASKFSELKDTGRHKEGLMRVPHILSRFLRSKRRKSSFTKVPSDEDGECSSNSLRSAVRDCNTDKVIELATSELTEIDGARQNGITALHEAAIDGNITSMKILVDHGAEINVFDSEGFTPLDYAVFGGDFECASYLIEKGAKIDRIRDGQISYKEYFRNNRSSTL